MLHAPDTIAQAAGPEPRQPRLLIVEDEAVVAMDMSSQLSGLGYDICGTADNASDALRLARLHRPDLVLMDVVIKGDLDGVQTAERLALSAPTPVVFLTAFSDAGTVSRAAKTAAYGYVTKPFQIRELRAAIDVALHTSALERQLRDSERWFAATLRCVADAVVATDCQRQVRYLNPAAETALGWRVDDAIGRPVAEVMRFEDDTAGAVCGLGGSAQTSVSFGRTLLAADGRRLPVDESVAAINAPDGQAMGWVHALRDVGARRASEAALRASEEKFRAVFDFAPVGMALISHDGRFLQGNAALQALLRCSPSSLTRLRHADVTLDEDAPDETARLADLLAGRVPHVQFERRYRNTAGGVLWALTSVSLLRSDTDAPCLLYQIQDLSAQKQAQQQLQHRAYHDDLTGLPNRALLRELTAGWIQSAQRHGTRFALVLSDLDRFKAANDRFGHAAGDDVLRATAQRLRHALRKSDVVGRLGGDEFAALLADVTLPEGVSTAVRKMALKVSAPVQHLQHAIDVGLSAGVAIYPQDATEVDALFRCADTALYRAKSLGRGRTCFFSEADEQQLCATDIEPAQR